MVLIVLAGVCLLTVPLAGGNLGRLASVRLGGLWTPVVALATQVVITVIAPGGHPALHKALHIATYVLIGVFLWANRRLPGIRWIAIGALMNGLAIVANGGVMPAAETAERLAGLHLRAGFDNSAHLLHPHLLWLGDIIPWPGPLHNVLSPGDLIIYAGTMILLHRACGRRAPRPIALSPLPDDAGQVSWRQLGRAVPLSPLGAGAAGPALG